MNKATINNTPIPAPVRYLDFEGFWKGIDDGYLAFQKCGSCGAWCHPPTPVCPDCHSLERTWQKVSGKGVVHSWVTYHDSPHPAFEAPFTVVLVELAEGLRIVSNLVDVPLGDIEIGMPVVLTIETVGQNLHLPKFKKNRKTSPAPLTIHDPVKGGLQ